MALQVTDIERVFKFSKNGKDITLDDPNPNFSTDDVLSYYSNLYSELTTATVHGPEIEQDKAIFQFKTTVGVKG